MRQSAITAVLHQFWQITAPSYANAGEYKQKGVSEFEKDLVRLGIRHVFARANHPHTDGKLERFHGELQRKLGIFAKSDYTKTARITDLSTCGSPFNTESNRDDGII